MESTTINTKIIEQSQSLYSQEFKLVQHDLGKTEELVKQKMQLLGQGLLQRLVQQVPNGYQSANAVAQ